MEIFEIEVTEDAKLDFDSWSKTGNKKSIQKIDNLLQDIAKSPHRGIGHPEPLCGDYTGYWSRRIDKKNRIVYRVNEEKKIVYIYSVRGHYLKNN